MTLSLYLLGPCMIKVDETWLSLSRAKKIEALLIYLAVERTRPHSRTALDGLLFPELSDKTARTNLRQTITRLQKAISNQQTKPPYLLLSGETLQFNSASAYSFDLAEFQAKLKGCAKHTTHKSATCLACIDRLKEAVALYRGPFLEGFFIQGSEPFERWLEAVREQIEQQMLTTLQRLADYYEQHGYYQQAVGFSQQQLTLAPWQERSHRQLMRLLARQGERGAALQQYQQACQILWDELGVEPTAETKALALQIQATETERPHNLPSMQGNLFVGRREEQRRLRFNLVNPQRRWLTLLGPGGIGKTHLALTVAWTLIKEYVGPFMDGVFFISLLADNRTASRTTTPLVMALVQALKLPLHGLDKPQHQVLQHLQGKECLLLIDNGEYLNQTEIAYLLDLIAQTNRVKMLVTARERLVEANEWVLPLTGLPYPLPLSYQRPLAERIKGPLRSIIETAKTFEAVQLFSQQAQQVVANLQPETLPPTEQMALVDICQQVQGHPLAIKLAAAWVHMLSCYEIAEEIRQTLDILSTEQPHLPTRHRSIQAVFDYSWQRLNRSEQQVLAQLALFQGSFDRPAAAQVARASLPHLVSLVNKSLLESEIDSQKTYYRLHPLLQQFITEKSQILEAELGLNLAETRSRQAHYYGQFLQECEPKLEGSTIISTLQKVERVIENVRAGWRWAIAEKSLALAHQYLSPLHLFYGMREWWHEAKGMFGEALALKATNWPQPDMTDEEALFFTALLSRLAEYHYALGELHEAETLLTQSQGIGNWVEEPCELALTHEKLGMVAYRRANYQQAKQYLEFSLQIARDSDQTYMVAHTLMSLGAVARDQGDYHQAKRLFHEAWQGFQQLDNVWGTAHAQRLLAGILGQLGEVELARHYNEVCLARFRDLNNPVGQALVWLNEGEIAHFAKDYHQAEVRYNEGLYLFESVDDKRGQALTLEKLGQVMVAQSNEVSAQSYFERSLQLTVEIGDVALCLKTVLQLAHLLHPAAHSPTQQLQLSQLLSCLYYHPRSTSVLKTQVTSLLEGLNSPALPPLGPGQQSLAELQAIVTQIMSGVREE